MESRPSPAQPNDLEPGLAIAPGPTGGHAPAPASWERGLPARCADVGAVRRDVLTSLYELRDEYLAPNDAAFLGRLIRVIGTENLDFPPFPDVARKLDALLKRGDPDMMQVVQLVERDPALVRRIWTSGSSASFTSSPDNLHQAISRIGLDALWRNGMSICMYSPVFRVAGYQARADAIREHGVVVGEMAAWLSGKPRGEEYLAGLLHDIGKLVVYRAASNKDHEHRPSEALLQRILDQHHSEISLLTASAWSLGEGVLEAIGFHHSPETENPTAKVLWTADVAAITAALGTAEHSQVGLISLGRAADWTPYSGPDILRRAESLLERESAETSGASAARRKGA